MSASLSSSKKLVTTRCVAAKAGVSSATVSLALRGHSRITAATRARVATAAAELGYCPDPQMAKLMHHLRVRRAPGFQANLCAITSLARGAELPYVRALIASVEKRAEALGYGLTLVRIKDAGGARRDLQRVLCSRGVEGIVMLTMRTPRDFTDLLDWTRFAVVAATNGVRTPDFHRVIPNHFNNMLALCTTLAGRGYRRIGLLMPAIYELASNHAFSAALLRHNFLGTGEPVSPLLYDVSQPAEVARWFKAQKPDAIVVPSAREAREIVAQLKLRVPGPVGIAVTTEAGQSIFAGMEERPAEIGANAVRLLASLLHHGELGVPACPTTMTVHAKWVEGASIRLAV